MFSDLGRAGTDSRDLRENLLDVAVRAGYTVAWIEDQSGCKGVCARVENMQLRDLMPAERCPDGECPDTALVDAVSQWLSRQAKHKPVLLVWHLMGSHGPAYWRRSADEDKVFVPECKDNMLKRCQPGTVDNAYDNSIRATDKLIGQLAEQLRSDRISKHWRAAMLYASDHGESLGEHGLFLHGMPCAIAPDVQKRVPMLLWTAEPQALALDLGCLARAREQALSHDHLFHSMLGLLEISTTARKPALDIISPCRTHRTPA
jgi:lipid A ethanolaminephosphotransferase